MLEEGSLQAALKEIVPQAFQATLFRCVSLRALLGLVNDPTGKLLITRPNPDFLYAGGPVIGGGRFTSLFGENFFRRAVPRKWSLVRAIGRWGIFQEWHDIGASRRPEDLLRFYCTRL
jgi:hypothetical protein